MRRLVGIIALGFVFLLGLGGAALATHTSEIEEHILPWVLVVGGQVVTGEVTITDTDALPHETIIETTTQTDTETTTVTVTEPPPTTTEPPPTTTEPPPTTTEPPPAGTVLTFTDQVWTCTQPLSAYGPLPVTVILDYTRNFADVGARIGSGCRGDFDPATIDLILDVRGDGVTFGPMNDAVRVMNYTSPNQGLTISGKANCGKNEQPANFHQDGIHAIGGNGIDFVDFALGDYDSGFATCHGAGGAFFYSGSGSVVPVNVRVLGGSYIACHVGLGFNPYNATGSVIGSKFRSGRVDGSDPPCTGFFAPATCSNKANYPPTFVFTGNTCQHWNGSGWTDQ